MVTLRAEWHGLKESLDFIERLGANAEQVVGRGVGRAALRVQADISGHVQNMVYAQPTSAHPRTYTLLRSVHAAHPDANHTSDEARARGGQSLAATSPDGLVGASGGVLVSEVGSWVSYASLVHQGVNQPQARPFVAVAVPAAEVALDTEIMRVIVEEFAKAPRM